MKQGGRRMLSQEVLFARLQDAVFTPQANLR
jgi:hypothetical protein